ncbi:unnamed protein product [Rhizophagus irregularis]|nr:unnamed protein product [Rhizophagus irregularis]CAB4446486.1 unnamed protein product [Rhizophagus irregularis]
MNKMCSKVDEAIKSYLEMHRPASWSYNYFLKNNKPLIIEELNGSPWPDKSSLWKKEFIRVAQQTTSKKKFIDKVMFWFKENAGSAPAKRCRRSCGYRPVITKEKTDKRFWREIEDAQKSEQSKSKIEKNSLRYVDSVIESSVNDSESARTFLSNKLKSFVSTNQYENPSRKQQPCQSLSSLFNDSSESVNDLESNSESNTSPCEVAREKLYGNKRPIGVSDYDEFFESDDEIEDVSTEVQVYIAKMRGINHRLFDYRIVNLSERDQTDPVNKVFTDDERKEMRNFWNNSEPSDEEKSNTIRRSKWENSMKQLVNKYSSAVEVKSVFDEEESSLETIFEKPFEGRLVFKTHYDLLWMQDVYKRFVLLFAMPFNLLHDPDETEFAYRESLVNPIIPKAFDDVSANIRFKTGEICMNAKEIEVGFLEVVGNAVLVDEKKRHDDLDKLLKAMVISIFYQRQYHLQRNATEEQLECIQSYGVLVYQRETTIYVMHFKEGLHIVDTLTNFIIPDSVDQAYVLAEIIEKTYFFKSRVMDYYLKLQKISRNVQNYTPSKEIPVQASPSKRAKTKYGQ